MQSPYALSIDAARHAIIQRARQYRGLVICVSLTGLGSVGLALALGRWWPLLVTLGSPGLVMMFHALDLRAVNRWRLAVLLHWSTGALQLDLLARTLQQVPGLPSSTVTGMVDSLPDWPGDAVPVAARPGLALAQDALGQLAVHALLARAMAWAAFVAVALAAWAVGRPALLLGWTLLPFVWVLWCGWQWLQVRRTRKALLQTWQRVSLDASANQIWLARLHWLTLPGWSQFCRSLNPPHPADCTDPGPNERGCAHPP